MADLTLHKLSFRRGSFSLELPDLRVLSGEKLAILGENGSGKSTLLQILCGLLPAAGEIRYGDERLSDLAHTRRAKLFALLPQQADVIFPFSVFEVVLFGRYIHMQANKPAEQDLAATRELLTRLDLEPLAERRFNQLSGGEQRRVMLARALNQQTEMLYLDEPNASLDVRHSLDLFGQLQASPRTIISPVHDINLAARHFERFWLLKDGKLLADVARADLSADLISETYDVQVSTAAESFTFSR